MNVLLTGASGQLGRELVFTCPNDIELVALDKHSLDITNHENVREIFNKYKPNVAINAAAYTSVEKAEVEQDLATRVNKDGVTNLALECKEYSTRLIHYSTDYIFNGKKWVRDASSSWENPDISQTDRDPVVCVSWDDANSYVGWFSRKTGKGYRLLSEAEWEYAARAGAATARYWGDAPSEACGFANVHDATSKKRNRSIWSAHGCDDRYAKTAPVGSFAANRFGLHDVLGNVWEWVEDCWNGTYAAAPTDGSAWTSRNCGRGVIRGGAWRFEPRDVRSAVRRRPRHRRRGGNLGFRIARTLF